MSREPSTLGAFSVSLAVSNLEASQAFYEKLGFEVAMGNPAENWLILRNGSITIGLFHGMFAKNTLTFNPGWDDQGRPVEPFTDVRDHQRRLQVGGIEPEVGVDERSSGPASLLIIDPDGNPILIDQHVGHATSSSAASEAS